MLAFSHVFCASVVVKSIAEAFDTVWLTTLRARARVCVSVYVHVRAARAPITHASMCVLVCACVACVHVRRHLAHYPPESLKAAQPL